MAYTEADWADYVQRSRAGREKYRRQLAVRSLPLPPWWNRMPNGWCNWCAKGGLPGRAKRWHPECVAEYHFCRNPAGARAVLDRSHGRCADCAVAMRYWRPHAEVLPVGHNVSLLRRVVADGLWCRAEPREHPWNADHIVPLWSVDRSLPWRRLIEFWKLPNLQALCPECHKAKTSREAADRARLRRGTLALAV